MKMSKWIIYLGCVSIVISLVFVVPEFLILIEDYGLFSYDYFVSNTFDEIGSKNIVTGIYLDYRVFDSIFEAGILFVVAAAILFMGKKD